ncbi:aromatic acid exporter family protein [Salisediminibacterium beveridgei]|uniref:Integral membrane protein n=1 Tax=Salisediminibacterium beveridgei TaxID=632773 RepID=A0A1D7QUK0_9BACI|nr:aromatic acid exporter family protein [Salisediminibacterium beveridgei]AOM82691.1 Integral membrane protein [Salisediminibacterium beveridgei]
MFKIGYRTIKTALGAAIAIFIAQLLQLDFYVSAGILTMLCIQKTRQRTIMNSWQRFVACIIGMIYAIALFETIGYHPLSVAFLLLIFIPTTVYLRVQSGIITSAVIFFHLYTLKEVSVSIIANELGLIVIGILVALVMNLYMPGKELRLEKMQIELENYYCSIFHKFASYIREGDSGWTGEEISSSEKLLKDAQNLALENLENHVLRYEDQYYHYFKMREKQLDIIERMMPLLTSMDYHVEQADMLADFMDQLAEGVNPQNTAVRYITELESLQNNFREMALPETRSEFEARSALLHLVHELQLYLSIKQQFKPLKSYGTLETS